MVQHKMAGMEPGLGLHIASGQVQNLLLQMEEHGEDWLVMAEGPPVLPVLRTAEQQIME